MASDFVKKLFALGVSGAIVYIGMEKFDSPRAYYEKYKQEQANLRAQLNPGQKTEESQLQFKPGITPQSNPQNYGCNNNSTLPAPPVPQPPFNDNQGEYMNRRGNIDYTFPIPPRVVKRVPNPKSKLEQKFAPGIVEPSRVSLGIDSKYWTSIPKGLDQDQFFESLKRAPMQSEADIILNLKLRNYVQKEEIIEEFMETSSLIVRDFSNHPDPALRFTNADRESLYSMLQANIQPLYYNGSKNFFRVFPDQDPEFESYVVDKKGQTQRIGPRKISGSEGVAFKKVFLLSLLYPDKVEKNIVAINNLYSSYQNRR